MQRYGEVVLVSHLLSFMAPKKSNLHVNSLFSDTCGEMYVSVINFPESQCTLGSTAFSTVPLAWGATPPGRCWIRLEDGAGLLQCCFLWTWAWTRRCSNMSASLVALLWKPKITLERITVSFSSLHDHFMFIGFCNGFYSIIATCNYSVLLEKAGLQLFHTCEASVCEREISVFSDYSCLQPQHDIMRKMSSSILLNCSRPALTLERSNCTSTNEETLVWSELVWWVMQRLRESACGICVGELSRSPTETLHSDCAIIKGLLKCRKQWLQWKSWVCAEAFAGTHLWLMGYIYCWKCCFQGPQFFFNSCPTQWLLMCLKGSVWRWWCISTSLISLPFCALKVNIIIINHNTNQGQIIISSDLTHNNYNAVVNRLFLNVSFYICAGSFGHLKYYLHCFILFKLIAYKILGWWIICK